MIEPRSLLLPTLLLLAGCEGVISEASPLPGPPSVETNSGILLTPPEGIGTEALECADDYAPLRRLNQREYANTLAHLFEGMDLPATPVPSDQRRGSFTNHFEVLNTDDVLVRAYRDNAVTLATSVAPSLIADLTCAPSAECFTELLQSFGGRAFRRPLDDAELTLFRSFYDVAEGDFVLATEMAIQTMLQSPAFLYRPEFGLDGELSQHEIASRLSYFLWASMPDDTLLAAAAAGELSGPSLEAHVDAMLRDDKAQNGLLAAASEWLDLERLETRLKAEEYVWNEEIRHDLRESLELFLWNRVFAEEGSLEELLTSPGAYINSTIGPIYGVADAGEEMEWREFDNRHGVLTHPAILATHAHGDYPSPVLRGVFILTEVLCDPPSPPPPGIPMSPRPEENSGGEALTNREGYVEQTESEAQCVSCHRSINPFGFGLENYDAIGAFQTTDTGSTIDASGASNGFTLSENFAFDGPQEMAAQLGESERVRACVVDRWIRYASGSGSLTYDPCLRADIEEVANRPGVTLRDVVLAIAVHPKFSSAQIVQEVSP